MKMVKSIGAVMAGFLTVVILSTGMDAVLEGIGLLPPTTHPELTVWWMLLIALIYRMAFTVAGGYVTAWLAPNRRMRHVLILGIMGVAGGVAGIFIGWNYGNHWYPIALAVTAFPCVWYGGTLKKEPEL